jgi:acyl-CoA dehydrogenase
VDINHENQQVGKGFELTRIPEGIPSQAEYLAEYCSASVKTHCETLISYCYPSALFKCDSLQGNQTIWTCILRGFLEN